MNAATKIRHPKIQLLILVDHHVHICSPHKQFLDEIFLVSSSKTSGDGSPEIAGTSADSNLTPMQISWKMALRSGKWCSNMIKHDQTTWKTSTKCHHSSLLIPPREVPRRLRADCNLSSPLPSQPQCRQVSDKNRTSLKGLQTVQTRLGVNPLNHLCCFWKPYIALYINVLKSVVILFVR